MKVRTYRADKLPTAFALVKRDLGPKAVILHTRTYKHGGLLGVGGRTVVEITAAILRRFRKNMELWKPSSLASKARCSRFVDKVTVDTRAKSSRKRRHLDCAQVEAR